MNEPNQQKQYQQTTGILLIMIATLSLSTEAISAKFAYQAGTTVFTALAARNVLGALLFWVTLIITKTPAVLPGNQLIRVIGLAIGGQAMLTLALFNAYKYIPAAMAILLFFVYPTITSVLSYFILKEPLHRRKLLALGLTLIGCMIILGKPMEALDPLGIFLALIAALINAIFLVFSGKVLSEVAVPVFNAYMTSSCAIFFLVVGLTLGEINFSLPAQGWVSLIYLGIICTFIAMFTFLKGITIIGASRSAIISSLQPAFTGVFGFFLLGEHLSIWQIIGGAVVLLGVLIQREEEKE
ncbi:DMT family transporter [Desulfotomaculum sp. 1211_IL3151]|uniref:DMT family transporter n=1 Tax=Desulfotomaculum sp. 1211_IL3151 TaxID=3084055 RepID=UPI002FDB2BCD